MSRSTARPMAPPPGAGARAGLRMGHLTVVLALLATLACGRGEATGADTGLTSEEFVEVIVELREAERAVMEEDSAQEMFVRRKTEILERHGTSEEEIRAFVAAAARDLPRLEAVWEEISGRLRRAGGEPDAVPVQ